MRAEVKRVKRERSEVTVGKKRLLMDQYESERRERVERRGEGERERERQLERRNDKGDDR